MNKRIEEYAAKGAEMDVMKALELLTLAYIGQCGVSMGTRTVIYDACEPWLQKLAKTDSPLAQMAKEKAMVEIMPYITAKYDPKLYDRYDVCPLTDEQTERICLAILNDEEFDEETNQAICWGTWYALTDETFGILDD